MGKRSKKGYQKNKVNLVVGKNYDSKASKYLSLYNLQVLAKTNSFRMRYEFIDQTLDVHKSNTVALKIMIMSNSH